MCRWLRLKTAYGWQTRLYSLLDLMGCGQSPESTIMPSLDPLNVNERLYRQVAALLEQLENNRNVTLRERFQALMAIDRIQYAFVNLR